MPLGVPRTALAYTRRVPNACRIPVEAALMTRHRGLSLRARVSRAPHDTEWDLFHGRHYLDPDAGKLREIDVHAASALRWRYPWARDGQHQFRGRAR